MKSKKNIKSIVLFAILGIVALFFINMSFAANNAKINVETANLRETADADGKILKQLSLNDEVELVEKSGEWYKVKSNDITGYIRQDLLLIKEEVTDNNITNNPIVENTTSTANTAVENAETTKAENDAGNVKEEKTKIVSEDTKLKIVPAINATDIVEVKANQEVTIIETINNWVCIQTGNTKGWIRSEKLKVKEEQKVEEKQEEQETEQEEKNKEEATVQETKIKTQFIASETVNLRKEPNTSSEIVSKLSLNMAVDVYSENSGWSKVKVSGKEGYISSSLLSDKKKESSRAAETPRTSENTTTTTDTTTTTSSAPASQNGGSVVETAKSYIGSSYVYGASGPSSFDCSGFTSYIYKQYGVSLNRTAAGQYSNGTAVSKDELQPGDLVMFGKSGINHVGIYIGGGQMVHAANPSRGVTTDTINSGYYYNNYVGARRVN